MSSKKMRNHYDLNEIENVKNVKIVSVAWHLMFGLKCLVN